MIIAIIYARQHRLTYGYKIFHSDLAEDGEGFSGIEKYTGPLLWGGRGGTVTSLAYLSLNNVRINLRSRSFVLQHVRA